MGVRTLYIESFNGKLRDELLDREVFYTLLEVRVLTERYRRTYNRVRPHSSLGYRPPAPEALLPADPIPVLFGLTKRVVQTSGAGQRIFCLSPDLEFTSKTLLFVDGRTLLREQIWLTQQ